MESIIGQIKSKLHQGDVVQLNVKNLYESVAPDGAFVNRIGEADGATEEELCDALERFVPCQTLRV